MSDPITSSASPRSRDATVPDRSVPASVTSRDPSPADGSVGRMNRRGHPALTVGLGQPKDGHTGEKGPSYSPGLAPPSRASNFQMETAAKRFGRFTVTEPKKVPVNIWESVDKAQAGVLDTLERSASLDASLKPFATVVSALHKGAGVHLPSGYTSMPGSRPPSTGPFSIHSPHGSFGAGGAHHLAREYQLAVTQLNHVRETLDSFAKALHVAPSARDLTAPTAVKPTFSSTHVTLAPYTPSGPSSIGGGFSVHREPHGPSSLSSGAHTHANTHTSGAHTSSAHGTYPGSSSPMLTTSRTVPVTPSGGSSGPSTASAARPTTSDGKQNAHNLSVKLKQSKEKNEQLLNWLRVLSQKLERAAQAVPAEVTKLLSAPADSDP